MFDGWKGKAAAAPSPPPSPDPLPSATPVSMSLESGSVTPVSMLLESTVATASFPASFGPELEEDEQAVRRATHVRSPRACLAPDERLVVPALRFPSMVASTCIILMVISFQVPPNGAFSRLRHQDAPEQLLPFCSTAFLAHPLTLCWRKTRF
jgi:hypothetical protein